MTNATKTAVSKALQFHHRLNPDLWDGDVLKLEVRIQLLRSAIAFYRFLKVANLVVRDIRMTGSNAAYNYTSLSDIDIHLIVEYSATPCPALSDNLFSTKKALWAETYSVGIKGHPVEMYVEDATEGAVSNGLYSLLRGEWLHHPDPTRPAPDDVAVRAKANAIMAGIETLLASSPTMNQIDDCFAILHGIRQNGLMDGGEFSTENLAYKAVRNAGFLDRLWNARVTDMENDLSLT